MVILPILSTAKEFLVSSYQQVKTEKSESDDVFAFIAGYTEGGFPYGVTWEEMKAMEQREKRFEDVNIDLNDDKYELPFD